MSNSGRCVRSQGSPVARSRPRPRHRGHRAGVWLSGSNRSTAGVVVRIRRGRDAALSSTATVSAVKTSDRRRAMAGSHSILSTSPTSPGTRKSGRTSFVSCAPDRCPRSDAHNRRNPLARRSWSGWKRSWTEPPPPTRTPGEKSRFTGSTAPSIATPFATCWRLMSMFRRSCRPTTPAMASTTSPVCCGPVSLSLNSI